MSDHFTHPAFTEVPLMGPAPVVLLTFDVEDWFQVENLRPLFPIDRWDDATWRVESSTRDILDLLEDAGCHVGVPVRATFFVLGSVAERFPGLVREIQDRGHEVASHGYWHRLCSEETPDGLRRDLSESRKLLEDIIGRRVSGYRAPGFSISDQVLQAVRFAGYRYDSSFNSFALNPRHGRISLNGRRRGIAHEVARGFHEIPVSNLAIRGRGIPWAGGGYFRLLPFRVFQKGVRHILDRDGAYVFYLHPWEFDCDQPRPGGVPAVRKFRHYCGLTKTAVRLRRLIATCAGCRFLTCTGYLDQEIMNS
ncbi:MAG: polysaccharide deacetylase family protein [Thermodesulfobacteriota bacterium]|nr:polysaccharide deacetylase family protein [Thermodesulfobacteriota bacterium]